MDKPHDVTPKHPMGPLPYGAPAFLCPSCESPLHYEGSHATDQSDELIDLKDFYRCPGGCGTFEHNRRTRHLRLLEAGYRS